jgi:hypothetical protein
MKNFVLMLMVISAGLAACAKSDTAATIDNSEMAQQVGDSMASVDESSGSSSGTISFNEARASEKMFARLVPERSSSVASALETWQRLLVPMSEATSCLLSNGTWEVCASNVITRTFAGCTIGTATVNGTVTLTWSGGASSCHISANGNAITREPDITISGPRGGTLTIKKSATVGQKLTRTSASLTLTGCGTGSFVMDSTTTDVVFDRCEGV